MSVPAAPANVDMLSVLVDWVEKGKAPGDLEVTEQKVEVPAICDRARAAAVPVAGLAALQVGTGQCRDEFCLRAVKIERTGACRFFFSVANSVQTLEAEIGRIPCRVVQSG